MTDHIGGSEPGSVIVRPELVGDGALCGSPAVSIETSEAPMDPDQHH
jgi:hypothetical protein